MHILETQNFLHFLCKFWKHKEFIFFVQILDTQRIYRVRNQQQLRLAQPPIIQQLEDQLKVRSMQIRGGPADFCILVSAYLSSDHSPAHPCSPRRAEEGEWCEVKYAEIRMATSNTNSFYL